MKEQKRLQGYHVTAIITFSFGQTNNIAIQDSLSTTGDLCLLFNNFHPFQISFNTVPDCTILLREGRQV